MAIEETPCFCTRTLHASFYEAPRYMNLHGTAIAKVSENEHFQSWGGSSGADPGHPKVQFLNG